MDLKETTSLPTPWPKVEKSHFSIWLRMVLGTRAARWLQILLSWVQVPLSSSLESLPNSGFHTCSSQNKAQKSISPQHADHGTGEKWDSDSGIVEKRQWIMGDDLIIQDLDLT